MIKLDSIYDYKTNTWSLRNKIYCRTKHKSNWWYAVDRPKEYNEHWDYTWRRPSDVELAPKLLTVWSK
jgi:hypothetical protein